MKEYFSHDYYSREDPKMVKLQMKLGMAGIGLYWCLIEILYEYGGFIPDADIKSISYKLRTSYERITNILQQFDLFYFDEGFYRSESADRRLFERSEKSELAKKSINARWDRIRKERLNTNVIRTNNDSNTIKVKESKEKDIEKRKSEFDSQIRALNFDLPEADTNDFISYWTDHNNGDRKMRFELEKKFYATRRLSTWKKNIKPDKFKQSEPSTKYDI